MISLNRKSLYIVILIFLFLIIGLFFIFKDEKKKSSDKLKATIINYSDAKLTVQDNENIIYTFKMDELEAKVGDSIAIKYAGVLDKNNEFQNVEVMNYEILATSESEDGIPSGWLDEGIFSDYYKLAYEKLKKMDLDEKIGQLFLVRLPDTNVITDLKKYKFGGYVLYEKDFRNKNETEVKKMIKELQDNSDIPLLIAVDEEGGKVVRVSSNSQLVSSKFKSPSELYALGGFSQIREDTINKSKILNNLGININLAPVVDVSTNPSNYMYGRTLGENTELTSTYAKTVISASKGYGVSYTLKHFPGYGNNADTHTGSVVDSRTYEDIKQNDLPPFEAGIKEGAEAVLVSHNTVSSIDSSNPASLSPSVHNLLRSNLNFSGVIITDDLAMGATSSIDNVAVKAILAGNDLIITTDYATDIANVKEAFTNGNISEDLIDKLAFRVIAWKYYKGLMFDTQK